RDDPRDQSPESRNRAARARRRKPRDDARAGAGELDVPSNDERSSMDADRPIPQPMTPEAKPFWDGLREDKLMLPKCNDCGHVFFYPRILCPRCHSRNVGWMQASGRGKLHAFEIA